MSDEGLNVSALADIAEEQPENLQAYADKVVRLNFLPDDLSKHTLFRGVKFSNLESLTLDASNKNDAESLKPYLQPNLKRLIYYGGPISDVFLDTLLVFCPQLEELLIDNPRDLISPEGVIRFLDGAKRLKRLSLMYGMKQAVTDSVVIAIATKPGLEVARFLKPITADLVSRAVREKNRWGFGGNLFPHLRTLTCVCEPDGLAGLSPHLSRLIDLDVAIIQQGIPSTEVQTLVMDVIGTHYPNLRVLKLKCTGTGEVLMQPQALVRLAQRLSQLEELHIFGKVKAPGFEDAHFSGVVQALPHLRSLKLLFECYLTEYALISVAKNCGTTLVELEIEGYYDLRNLTGKDILFSELSSLEVGELVRPPHPIGYMAPQTATNIASLLKSIAPKLEYLDTMRYTTFGSIVCKTFRSLV